MPKRWHQFRNPWDREYAMRGGLWRGESPADFLHGWVAPGTRVIELGCGDGKFLAGLEAAGFLPVGVDFSRHALRHAQTRLRSPLLLGDVRALPFATGAVEAVAARYVLGALEKAERERAAQEIRRVSSTKALIVVEEFSTQDFRAGVGKEVETRTFERNRGILTHYFERDEIPPFFPDFEPVAVDELTSAQRTREGTKQRHRRRWVLRRSA